MNEPRKFPAGDSQEWTETFSDYPAGDSWVATCYIRGAVNLDVTGSADGDAFKFMITAAQSATLTPGKYVFSTRVSKGTEAKTVSELTVEVADNIASQAAGYESRSFAQRMIDALEAVMEKRASQPQRTMSIGQRTIETLSPAELRVEWHRWRRVRDNELAQERINQGLDGGNKILARITSPI